MALPQNDDQLQDETRVLSLQPEAKPTRSISLSPRNLIIAKTTAADAELKVQKAHFALADASPGLPFLMADFVQTGGEQTRQIAAISEDQKLTDVNRGIVEDVLGMAQQEGRPVNEVEQDLILGLSEQNQIDLNTVLEELYAKRLVRTGTAIKDPEEDTTLTDAMEENEEGAQQLFDEAEGKITNQEIALDLARQMKHKYDNTPWLRWGVDLGALMLPLIHWSNITDVAENIPEGSTLTGDNIRETLVKLHALPPAEFRKEATTMLNKMYEDNVLDAMFMAQALVGYTNLDQQWDNDMFKADVADVAGSIVTLGVLPVAKAGVRLGRKIKAISRVNSGKMSIEDGLAAAGDLEQASVETAMTRMSAADPKQRVLKSITDLGKQVPGMLDANYIARDAGGLTAERARRIVEDLTRNRESLMKFFTDAPVIQRYGAQAQEEAFNSAKRRMLRDYNKIEDAIVDIVPVRESEEIFGGVDRVDFYFGRLDGTSFDSYEDAAAYASKVLRLPKNGYDIIFEKGNYFARMFKHVDETETGVMDLRVQVDAPDTSTAIKAWQAALHGKTQEVRKIFSPLSSPDDILSAEEVAARKVATFGGNRAAEFMVEAAKPIGALNKKESARLQTVLERNHFETRSIKQPDGSVEKVTGNRYLTIGELRTGWKRHTGQYPNDKEMLAYFTFGDVMDQIYKANNISKYRDKARLGIEQKAVSFVQELDGRPTLMTSPFFEGKTLDKLPHWGSEPFTIMWQKTPKSKISFNLSTKLFPKEKKAIEELLASGKYQVIQTLDGGGPLRNTLKTGGERIDYVIADKVQAKPLEIIQIPHRFGGNRRYGDHGGFLKQPNVTFTRFGRAVRSGDITAHWDPSFSKMQEVGAAYEEARKMILSGASNRALGKYVKQNLPWYKSGADFKRYFRGVDGSPEDAPFDIRSPFVVVRSRQDTGSLVDLKSHFGQEFVDLSNSEHNLGARVGTYMGQERSEILTRVVKDGTEDNPIWNLEPAQIVDPMSSLQRSLQQLLRSRFYVDYEKRAIEDWAVRAERYLDVDPQLLKANPMPHVVSPKWKKTPDNKEKMFLNAQRRAILQLLGAEELSWGPINNAFQTVADGIAKRVGKDTEQIVDAWRWTDPKLSPGQFLRSLAFTSWLGLWNPRQLGLQGQAVMHMAAATGNPVRAAQSVFGYMLMRQALYSHENKLSVIAKVAKNVTGLSEDTFKEMYYWYNRSGMHEFRGEHAALDMYFRPGIIKSMGKKAVDNSMFFFREGNLLSRGSSFAAAFLEYRKQFPLKKLTDRDLAKIESRASVLSVDQARDSINPIYEQGALKFPTQFFTFYSRLSDQFFSTRLTPMEKIRLATMYSMVYGLPTGVAVGTGLGRFWPFHEQAKEWALANGTDLQANPLMNFLLNGGGYLAIQAMTDEEFDVAGSWGPGGLPWLRDVINGESTTLELLAGASGSFYGELIRTAQPFAMYISDLFSPTGTDTPSFTLKDDDFVRVLRSISSFNAAYGVYAAYQYQTAFSRGGTPLGESKVDVALVSALTGWPTEKVADAWRMYSIGKRWDAEKKGVSNLALQEFKKGVWALYHENDEATFREYTERAYTILQGSGLNPVEKMKLMERALKDNSDFITEIEQNFPFRGPVEQQKARHDKAYREIERKYKEMEEEFN